MIENAAAPDGEIRPFSGEARIVYSARLPLRAIAADHFRRLERTRIDRAEEIALDLALMKEAAQRVKHEPDKLELARKAVENPGDSDAVGI